MGRSFRSFHPLREERQGPAETWAVLVLTQRWPLRPEGDPRALPPPLPSPRDRTVHLLWNRPDTLGSTLWEKQKRRKREEKRVKGN